MSEVPITYIDKLEPAITILEGDIARLVRRLKTSTVYCKKAEVERHLAMTTQLEKMANSLKLLEEVKQLRDTRKPEALPEVAKDFLNSPVWDQWREDCLKNQEPASVNSKHSPEQD